MPPHKFGSVPGRLPAGQFYHAGTGYRQSAQNRPVPALPVSPAGWRNVPLAVPSEAAESFPFAWTGNPLPSHHPSLVRCDCCVLFSRRYSNYFYQSSVRKDPFLKSLFSFSSSLFVYPLIHCLSVHASAISTIFSSLPFLLSSRLCPCYFLYPMPTQRSRILSGYLRLFGLCQWLSHFLHIFYTSGKYGCCLCQIPKSVSAISHIGWHKMLPLSHIQKHCIGSFFHTLPEAWPPYSWSLS